MKMIAKGWRNELKSIEVVKNIMFMAKATSLMVAPQSFCAIVPQVWRNV